MSNTILDDWSNDIPGGGYVGIEEYAGETLPFRWSVQTADDRIVGRGQTETEGEARQAIAAAIERLIRCRA